MPPPHVFLANTPPSPVTTAPMPMGPSKWGHQHPCLQLFLSLMKVLAVVPQWLLIVLGLQSATLTDQPKPASGQPRDRPGELASPVGRSPRPTEGVCCPGWLVDSSMFRWSRSERQRPRGYRSSWTSGRYAPFDCSLDAKPQAVLTQGVLLFQGVVVPLGV